MTTKKKNVSWLKGGLKFLQGPFKINFFLPWHSFLRDLTSGYSAFAFLPQSFGYGKSGQMGL